MNPVPSPCGLAACVAATHLGRIGQPAQLSLEEECPTDWAVAAFHGRFFGPASLASPASRQASKRSLDSQPQASKRPKLDSQALLSSGVSGQFPREPSLGMLDSQSYRFPLSSSPRLQGSLQTSVPGLPADTTSLQLADDRGRKDRASKVEDMVQAWLRKPFNDVMIARAMEAWGMFVAPVCFPDLKSVCQEPLKEREEEPDLKNLLRIFTDMSISWDNRKHHNHLLCMEMRKMAASARRKGDVGFARLCEAQSAPEVIRCIVRRGVASRYLRNPRVMKVDDNIDPHSPLGRAFMKDPLRIWEHVTCIYRVVAEGHLYCKEQLQHLKPIPLCAKEPGERQIRITIDETQWDKFLHSLLVIRDCNWTMHSLQRLVEGEDGSFGARSLQQAHVQED